MSALRKIYSGTSISVNKLAHVLNDIGIYCIVKNNQESARLAGFGALGQSIDLLINERDLEKATSILKNFEKEF